MGEIGYNVERNMRTKLLTGRARPMAVFGIATAMAVSAAVSQGATDGTRATMTAIFENMQLLLGVSADQETFSAPANAYNVAIALREVSDQAALLSGHASAQDADTAFLGSALDRYATWTLWAYERREYERARSLLHGTTDICIACHTRLPSGDSPLADRFIDSDTVQNLSIRQRASLQTATRRFDDALGSLEILLADESLQAEDLVTAVSDYLTISIRVKEDLNRPRSILDKLSERKNLTRGLSNDIARWKKALNQLAESSVSSSDLGTARTLLRDTVNERPPAGHGALIEQVAASGILHRYLRSHVEPSAETAEAYFLLGLAEYRIAKDPWLPKAELYLEKAILAAPKSPSAAEAYDLLKEKLSRVYTSASGVHFPEEVATYLRDLESMVTGDTY